MKRRWITSLSSSASLVLLGTKPTSAFSAFTTSHYFSLHRHATRTQASRKYTLLSSGWNKIESATSPATTDQQSSSMTTTPKWTVCGACRGQGKVNKRPARKALKRAKQESALDETTTKPAAAAAAATVTRHVQVCKQCEGSGLKRLEEEDDKSDTAATSTASPSPTFPTVAIIGGGLAGLALATACRHRNIPCRVYERDQHFLDRSQGYGLTLQQASKALIGFGIRALQDGVVSTKHVVHKTDGTVVGEWGFRQWGRSEAKRKEPKRQNVHIARQALRYQLLMAAGGQDSVHWNHKLLSFKEEADHVSLKFQVGDTIVEERADVLVGADGIRSAVREQWIGEANTPLRYLDCMVLLGICPLASLDKTVLESELLDGATVFQTADGETRIYMMPYSTTEYMWQLSFPMDEATATNLSRQGATALKQEALSRCQSWHSPVHQILQATPDALISGYPVYDRSLLDLDTMTSSSNNTHGRITLIGDACHPMSPFKGQGANQALLDALQLARALYRIKDNPDTLTRTLTTFALEMLERSSVKVKASADAAQFLHSDVAIQEGNVTRGAAAAAATTTAVSKSS